MIQQIKKLILLSLGADLIASLLFIFSLQLKMIPIIVCFYAIAMLLVICSILACFNNYKQYKIKILLLLILISMILLVLFTMTVFSFL